MTQCNNLRSWALKGLTGAQLAEHSTRSEVFRKYKWYHTHPLLTYLLTNAPLY